MEELKISLDLQLFGDSDKTEEPTPKRKRDAREEGQIVQSKEINTVVILFSCFLTLKILGGKLVLGASSFMERVFKLISQPETVLSENNIMLNFLKIVSVYGIMIAPILAVAFVSALLINYVQVGFLFTTKTLKFDLKKINPMEGFKRIFSKKSIIELFKSIFKILLIGLVVYRSIPKHINKIIQFPNMEMGVFLNNFADIVFSVLLRILAVLMILAIADYFFQWRQHKKSLMMTKQEIKEEFKQTEGDPQIKGKIRQRQREMAASRMMQQVPEADVIITNPTHFAVAIKYDPMKYDAPYVLAKGQNLIAQNIKKVGKEHKIPIIEDKKLARHLYSSVNINDLIPEELYEVIAEILVYVYGLD